MLLHIHNHRAGQTSSRCYDLRRALLGGTHGYDAEFEEGKHPRAKTGATAGQFVKKGAGGGEPAKKEVAEGKKAAAPSAEHKQSKALTFQQGQFTMPKEINGIAVKSWSPPQDDLGVEDWGHVDGQGDFYEPDLPKGHVSTGVLISEKDGSVWLMKPSKSFGGYKHSFPKGELEEELHPRANAIKEAFEETGLKVKLKGFAGDYEGDTGTSRYYYAERESGDPSEHGWESEASVLVPKEELYDFLN